MLFTFVIMWKAFLLCIFCASTTRIVYGSLEDQLAQTTRLCCNKGKNYARNHTSEECTSAVPPDVPPNLGSFCIFAMDGCCKEYFQKKQDCDTGMEMAESLHRCNETEKALTKNCCDECLRGKAAGASSGAASCEELSLDNSEEQFLPKDSYARCCKGALKTEQKSTHTISDYSLFSKNKNDDLFSVCDEYSPNELCAHHCIPIPGSYKCVCNPGFMLMADGRNCIEVVKNRCKPRNPCEHKCNDNGVEVKCSCRRGYELMADEKSCKDIDECALDPPVCLSDTKCHNLQGSYKCVSDKSNENGQCPSGYRWNINNGACDDVDECKLPRPPCPDYLCENILGSYKCGGISGNPDNLANIPRPSSDDRCPQGFTMGINEECQDVNECVIHKDNCNPLSQFCINTKGSFHCQDKGSKYCPPGFQIDRKSGKCEDIDECEHGQDICSEHLVCVNTLGEYDCRQKTSMDNSLDHCPEGMRLKPNSTLCEDIDECVEGIHLCDPQFQNCLNTNGSYECNCKLGYKLDHTQSTCVDINECATGQHNCIPDSQRCDNTVGSFLCVRILSCGTGYILQHSTGMCEDIDECALGTHDCGHAGPEYHCQNIPGSFSCVKTSTEDSEYEYEYYDVDEEIPDANQTNIKEQDLKPNVTSTTTTATEVPSSEIPSTIATKTTFTESSPVTQTEQEEKNTNVVPDYNAIDNDINSILPLFAFNQPSETSSQHQTTIQPDNTIISIPTDTSNLSERKYNSVLSKQPGQTYDYEPKEPSHNLTYVFESTEPTKQIDPSFSYDPKEPKYNLEPTNKALQPDRSYPQEHEPTIQPDSSFSYEPKEPLNKVEKTYSEKPPKPTIQPDQSFYYEPRVPPVDSDTYITRPPKEDNGIKTEISNEIDNEITVPEFKYTTDSVTSTGPTSELVNNITPAKEAATVNTEKATGDDVSTEIIPKNVWEKTKEKPLDCQPGFELDDYGACFDINECSTNTHSCSGLTEVCINMFGGYRCECAPDFRRDLVSGECLLVSTTSTTTSTTTPRPTMTTTEKRRYFWGYPDTRHLTSRPFRPWTLCDAGYHLDSKTGKCEDINECTNGQARCAAVEICINTKGGYRCECPPNWTLDKTKHRCMPLTRRGQFPPGYENEPVHIPQVPEVVGNEDTLDRNNNEFTDAGHVGTISCPNGYKVSYDNNCEDIDECFTGAAKCGPQQICTNSPGGYTCSCPQGLKLVADHQCEDVDECKLAGNRPICSVNADCINTIGSYHCQCHKGFTPAPANDKVCVDIDECTESRSGSLCQHRCNNVWGGYRCSCHRGYKLNADNKTCSDVDECMKYKSKLLCVGYCLNEPGSYRCTCPQGYRLSEDKKSCIDINECETGEAPCATARISSSSSDVCLNTRGSYRCHRITCPSGYRLEDKHRCRRIEQYCQPGDWECAHQPTTYSYNYITFVSNLYIPDNKVDLFTMRGPKWPFAKMRFQLRLVNVNAPPTVKERADINAFLLVQTSNDKAMLSLTKPLKGPQTIELELSMELYDRNTFGGIAVAKLFIHVSEHEF